MSGGNTKSWAIVPMMGPEAAPIQEGKYGRNLATNNPECRVGAIGAKIYQVAMAMMRDL